VRPGDRYNIEAGKDKAVLMHFEDRNVFRAISRPVQREDPAPQIAFQQTKILLLAFPLLILLPHPLAAESPQRQEAQGDGGQQHSQNEQNDPSPALKDYLPKVTHSYDPTSGVWLNRQPQVKPMSSIGEKRSL
jgi:hypothetical protein